MFALAIFFIFLVQPETIQPDTVNIPINLQENFTNLQIPQVDVLGGLVNLIHGFLSQASRNNPPPTEDLCRTHFVRLGRHELKVSQYPYGSCTYCCPINNPAQYVELYFTNKANAGNTIRLKMGRKPGALRSAGINSTSPTVIFIHGFTEHGLGPCPRIIRDAYLSRNEDYNIILVEWGELSPMPWYPQAAQNTKVVGSVLAKFIKFYSGTGELPISNLHLVGFSLGAHIAGFAGKLLKDTEKIPRITALDPAGPMFPIDDESQRLSKNDADYVDVIHTNAGMFGFPAPMGHADFYPNGGTFVQPGCEISKLAERKGIELIGMCGHLRAWRYYAESVRNPYAFPATHCGILENGSFNQCRFVTEGHMGFAANNNSFGNYYLTTNDRKPYAKSAHEQEEDMKTVNLVL